MWAALTEPVQMKQWMSEATVDIITDWQPGSPINIRGQVYKKPFDNLGTVVTFEPPHQLAYTHLSSLSHLPDEPDSYTLFSFTLKETGNGTELTFTATNFPTDAIYHHIAFYWNVTLELLKKYMEEKVS